MTTLLSSGFREDCSEFLSDFVKLGAPDYETFCQEWKRTNFQYIFFGRNTDAEMAEYLGEIFYIVKKFFFSSKNQFERIGAFYLLYTLYFKQPLFMFCKIRLTISEWRSMKDFAKCPYNGQELPQISVILWKLFKSDAFRFVQDELERGFDRFFFKNCGSSFDSSGSLRTHKDLEKELQQLAKPNGLVNAIEILEMGYNEMKEALDDSGPVPTDTGVGDRIPQSTLMKNLRHDFDSLMDMLRSSGSQASSHSNFKTTEDEPETMGSKRYALRRKAYKREVKQKVFRIAGRESEPESEESDEQVPSFVPERLPTCERHDQKHKTAFRNIRRKVSKLSDDENEGKNKKEVVKSKRS